MLVKARNNHCHESQSFRYTFGPKTDVMLIKKEKRGISDAMIHALIKSKTGKM